MTHVLIIGGSSGMGLALARRMVGSGTQVTIAGRSAERLAAAAATLREPGRRRGAVAPPGEVASTGAASVEAAQSDAAQVNTAQVDVADEDQVKRLIVNAAPLDHIVVTAADPTGAYAPVAEFPLNAARAILDTKLVGPWLVAKHAANHLPGSGSLTFTSGIAAYRPGPGASIIATANGALEALARSLALELAPIRVNVVSPGWVDTPIWDALAGDTKGDRFAAMAARLPAGRVGQPEDVAYAFEALMRNGFITGTVLHVDGGHRLI